VSCPIPFNINNNNNARTRHGPPLPRGRAGRHV